MKKKILIIHPFLFSIYPVLFLFSHNIDQVIFKEILIPIAIILISTLSILILIRLLFGNYQKSGLITSFFLILFFSYKSFYVVLTKVCVLCFIGPNRLLYLIWTFIMVIVSLWLIKINKNLDNFTKGLNFISLFLFMLTLINIGFYQLKTNQKNKPKLFKNNMNNISSSVVPFDKTKYRDIYYIVLDGYAGRDTLKDIYQYDNNEFYNYLIKKNFKVAYKSRSNYAMTYLSLASTLNMEYLDYFYDEAKNGSKNQGKQIDQMIYNSKVMNFLRSKGYKIIQFSSGVGTTKYNSLADININSGWGNDFTYMLFQQTMLFPFGDSIIVDDLRKKILTTFQQLPKVNKINGPKFIFAHINCPHPPFLFNADGTQAQNVNFELNGPIWGDKKSYLNQLIFLNSQVKIIIDEILKQSDPLPIIIIQSDHGSYGTFYDRDFYIGDQVTDEKLKERMRNFSAFYLPDIGDNQFYNSLTNVNSFRLVFNLYFQTEYKLLEDKSYFSSWDYPFKFIDVTKKVKYD